MTPAPPLASKVLARPDPDLRPAHRPEGSSRPDKENVVLLISNGASRRTAGHRRQNRCASLTWPVVASADPSPCAAALDAPITVSRMAGSRRRRSAGSEVTTYCPVRRAQITTWASTMSDVPLAASSLPTFVASTRPRSTTSVVGWRTSRASRTCRSGRRIAWASAVAGTVTRALVSRARARSPDHGIPHLVQVGEQHLGLGHQRIAIVAHVSDASAVRRPDLPGWSPRSTKASKPISRRRGREPVSGYSLTPVRRIDTYVTLGTFLPQSHRAADPTGLGCRRRARDEPGISPAAVRDLNLRGHPPARPGRRRVPAAPRKIP